MSKPRDITGMRFGKLTALKPTGELSSKGYVWLCRCDCGKYREAPVGRLTAKQGHARSCIDCAKKSILRNQEMSSSSFRQRRREKLHSIWNTMKQRCYNSNNGQYQWYGARGIKVCEEWKNSYAVFKKWALSVGYTEGMTIERLNVEKGYSPDNCKWASMREQNYNKRNTLYIIYKGIKVPLAKLVFDLGLEYNPIKYYLDRYAKENTSNI